MKRSGKALALVLALTAVSTTARAQFTWIGGSVVDGNLTTVANWQGGSVPTGSGSEDVVFGALVGTQNIVVVPSVMLRHLTFASGRPSYVFNGAPGPTTAILQLNGNITLTSGSSVAVSSSLSLALPSGGHVVDIDGPSTILDIAGAVSGPGSLLKLGTGMLVFSGVVDVLGGSTLQAGLVEVDGGSLTHGSSNLVVGTGSGNSATLLVANDGNVGSNLSRLGVDAGSTGSVSVMDSGSTFTTSGTLEIGVAGTGLLSVTDGGTASSDFGLIGASAGGQGSAVVSGDGAAWHNGQTLFVGKDGIGALAITSGGTVTSDFANAGYSPGATGTIVVDGAGSTLSTTTQMSVGYGGTGMLTIINGGSVSTPNALIATLAGSVGFVTVDGVGSTYNGTTNLRVGFAGSGTLVLANGGVASVAGGSGTMNLGGSGTGSLNIGNIAGGPAAAGGYIAATQLTTTGGTGQLQFNTTGNSGAPYYFTSDGTQSGSSAIITGITSVINNAGYNVIAGANTYTGSTNVNGGELVAAHNTAFGSGGLVLAGAGSATARFLTAAPTVGSLAASGPGKSLYFAHDSAVFTVNQTQNSSFHGEIRSDAPGDSIRVVKSGAGTLRLESGGLFFHNGTVDSSLSETEISLRVSQGTLVIANPFFIEDSSPTFWVSGGTLALENKTIANPVVVSAGARLAGTGTLSSAFNLGSGTIAPGFSTGTFTFGAGLTLSDGGAFDFEVQSAAGAAGTGYDTISVSGGILDLGALGTGGFTLRLMSLTALGASGNVADFSSSTPYSWTLFNAPGGITGFSASDFTINTTSFTNNLGGGNFFLSQSGNQILLNFAAVPEPSTYALMAVGLALLAARRRRRQS